ncbi:MAG: FxLYD domain-containing protein, partial [Selenomonas sp.]|nr:FxLYD domain-containing protein [Selenomonas sp.]
FQNPEGNSTAYEYTKILVTAYDANGTVLATDDQTMNTIQPREKQFFGTVMDSHGQAPAKVDFAIESGTPKAPAQDALKSSDFQIEGVTERNGEFGTITYTGTVKNNGAKAADSVGVAVALKSDGKLVLVENTYVDNLAVGQQKAFEINVYSEAPTHNSYEIIAYNWGF